MKWKNCDQLVQKKYLNSLTGTPKHFVNRVYIKGGVGVRKKDRLTQCFGVGACEKPESKVAIILTINVPLGMSQVPQRVPGVTSGILKGLYWYKMCLGRFKTTYILSLIIEIFSRCLVH